VKFLVLLAPTLVTNLTLFRPKLAFAGTLTFTRVLLHER
jgi:hypothetical protein